MQQPPAVRPLIAFSLGFALVALFAFTVNGGSL